MQCREALAYILALENCAELYGCADAQGFTIESNVAQAGYRQQVYDDSRLLTSALQVRPEIGATRNDTGTVKLDGIQGLIDRGRANNANGW